MSTIIEKAGNAVKNLVGDAKKAIASERVKVRMLMEKEVDGILYKVNSVVSFVESKAKELCQLGCADAHPDAVAHCIENLGAEVVEHGAEPAKEVEAAAGA